MYFVVLFTFATQEIYLKQNNWHHAIKLHIMWQWIYILFFLAGLFIPDWFTIAYVGVECHLENFKMNNRQIKIIFTELLLCWIVVIVLILFNRNQFIISIESNFNLLLGFLQISVHDSEMIQLFGFWSDQEVLTTVSENQFCQIKTI